MDRKRSQEILDALDKLKTEADNLWNRAWTYYWYRFEYMLSDTRLTFQMDGRQ